MILKSHIALAVEDEPLISMLACDLLADMSYIILEKRTSRDAMVLLTETDGMRDVDLADGSSGVDLAVRVKQEFPTVRIVVASGQVKPPKLPDNVPFIAKPYRSEGMTTAFRSLLVSILKATLDVSMDAANAATAELMLFG